MARTVRPFFAALPAEYRECRVTMRHRYDSHNVIEHKKDKELEVIEVCSVCGAQRTQILDLRDRFYGQIKPSRTRMRHPQGYLAPAHSGGWMTVEERGVLRMARLGY